MRQWLVIGPFPDLDHSGLEKPLLDETTLAPSHGEQANGFTWQSVASSKDFIDLVAQFTPNIDVLAYAHLYLYAPAPTPCTLVFGSDDGIRIWLNGALVYALHISRSADPNQNTQAITLQQGWNRLLVKNNQESGGWGFFMRLQTPDGKPLTGIKYQLDRP